MNLHVGLWVKVKIKDFIYYGIIAAVYETSVDLMVRSPDDNLLRKWSVQIEDIIGIGGE